LLGSFARGILKILSAFESGFHKSSFVVLCLFPASR
jgi:hypothetical protein